MKISILAGAYATATPALRVAYPVNMVPVPGQDGVTDGYLKPIEGIDSFTTGQGSDRGGRVWSGPSNGPQIPVHYRVSGTKLISITAAGVVAVIGDVGGSGPVRMEFGFDRLGILSGGLLYYWDNVTLTHVTDVNIPANLIDMIWVDGYFMVTDGVVVATSNLADPTVFNPLKFGSTDRPDAIQGLAKVRNEPWVVSRNFLDVFTNVGGALFPFQRVKEAVIMKGALGARAQCVFGDALAFLGGGLNESVSIYLASNGAAVPIASVEITRLLTQYTDAQLASVVLEEVVDDGSQFLFVHLPDRAVVYDAVMSAAAGQPVWHVRVSALVGFAQYKARFITKAFGAWVVGDPSSSAIGRFNPNGSQHYGADVRWEFGTLMIRNGGKGGSISELELFALTGSVSAGKDPTVSTSYTLDGQNYSQDKPIRSGKIGDTMRRLKWLQQGPWRKYRIQRFRGDSQSRLAALGLEAQLEAFAY